MTPSLRSSAAPVALTPRIGRRWCFACISVGLPTAGFRRSCSKQARGRRRAQAGDVQRARRERLRHAEGRARRPPARSAIALRSGTPAPHVLCAGDRQPAARRRRGHRDRRSGHSRRHVPGVRSRRPARQQDRFGRPYYPLAHGRRRPVPERSQLSNRQTALRILRSRKARGARAGAARRRARAGARVVQDTGFGVKSAAMCSIRTSRSRTTGRATKVETPRCSTATSTPSSTPICSPARPDVSSKLGIG